MHQIICDACGQPITGIRLSVDFAPHAGRTWRSVDADFCSQACLVDYAQGERGARLFAEPAGRTAG